MPTVKELHNKIRQHNASNCIKGYSNKKKATLVQIVSKLKTPCCLISKLAVSGTHPSWPVTSSISMAGTGLPQGLIRSDRRGT